MKDKKRLRRSRISKKDEKTLNEKIALGIGTSFIFLAIFFITYSLINGSSNSMLESETPYKEMTNAEKFEYIKESGNKVNGETNYQLAVNLADRTYCKEIKDRSLKSKCISETPLINMKEKVEVKKDVSDKQIVDETNYQLAITLGDVKYCKKIVDSGLQSKCKSELKA